MSDLTSLALPHIAKLHAYTPGLQPTELGWTKLNTNECPYAPSPRVTEALRREIGEDGASLRLYPSPKSSPLRTAIASHHGEGLTAENVCVGNGSDDILNLLIRAFCTQEAAAGYTLPSYSLYPVLIEIQDGATQVIEFDRAMRLPFDRIAASTARAFFLTSPNAPTGSPLLMPTSSGCWRRFVACWSSTKLTRPLRRKTPSRCSPVIQTWWSSARSRKPSRSRASGWAMRSRIRKSSACSTACGTATMLTASRRWLRSLLSATRSTIPASWKNQSHPGPLHPRFQYAPGLVHLRVAGQLHFHGAKKRSGRGGPGDFEVRLRFPFRPQSPRAPLSEARLDRPISADQRGHR